MLCEGRCATVDKGVPGDVSAQSSPARRAIGHKVSARFSSDPISERDVFPQPGPETTSAPSLGLTGPGGFQFVEPRDKAEKDL